MMPTLTNHAPVTATVFASMCVALFVLEANRFGIKIEADESVLIQGILGAAVGYLTHAKVNNP